MSRLTDLLRAVEKVDPQLAADLSSEYRVLNQRREFGLNFERHTPETVELPGRPIRRGDKVRFVAERGQSSRDLDERLWRVASISHSGEGRVASLICQEGGEAETETVVRPCEDLVVVAEFRDPIYPGLVSTGRIERGDDKPFHTVLNAENFHALQALLYTHEGKIDAIYIDPPYNTGARDWKYNNDYVDGDDIYRHSKWLAFMERRLKLAQRLLNPADSVLIVTIDEKEYLRLGLLLEQTFTEATIQMVTSSIKPSGSQRSNEFSRVEEYLFFVMLGAANPSSHFTDMLRDGAEPTSTRQSVTWHGLRRRGSTDWKRSHRPNGFYPVFVDSAAGTLHSVGEPIHRDADRQSVVPPTGTFAAWPLDPRNEESRWQISPARLREQLAEGTAVLAGADPDTQSASISYLKGGDLNKVRSGEVRVVGRAEDGRVIVEGQGYAQRRPKTMWLMESHDASAFGTALLSKFLPERRFPFPKSLYAVEDALRFFLVTKPNAVVLDFFSGSGTTAHAVMRLNKQDSGSRRSICVTNNEVSAEEQAALRANGLRPGDVEWEELGICDYITKPRIMAAVTGLASDGTAVQGNYRFVDEFRMSDGFSENVEFLTLTYETPRTVAHHRAFEKVAPMLWLRAGATGRRIDSANDSFDVADVYGVLFDMDASTGFLETISASPAVRLAFIVTDDDRAYQMVCGEMPSHVEPVRLYSSYLDNFTINTGKG